MRGCWALNKLGEPCGAARRAEGDYCNAHSGIGISANPQHWGPIGGAIARENRTRRAILRTELGLTRPNTLRGSMKAQAYVARERIAARVIGAILDDSTPPERAARLGLDLIEAVDPQATATLTMPTDAEGVGSLSLSQLMAVGERMGIPLPPSEPASEPNSG